MGLSHETPAAASAGLQPTRLARSGNRAFTRRAETTSIGLKPMRLVPCTTRQIRSIFSCLKNLRDPLWQADSGAQSEQPASPDWHERPPDCICCRPASDLTCYRLCRGTYPSENMSCHFRQKQPYSGGTWERTHSPTEPLHLAPANLR